MAKHITFTFTDGNKYTLEFNREAVQALESRGFNLTKLAEAPANNIPRLFAGALRMHHSRLKPAMIDKMRGAFEKGFKEAGSAWGKDLPDISKQTYDAVMKGFDDWKNEAATEAEA